MSLRQPQTGDLLLFGSKPNRLRNGAGLRHLEGMVD